jgi:hypothetical protein
LNPSSVGPSAAAENVVSNRLGDLTDPAAATIEARNSKDLLSVAELSKQAVLLRALTTQELHKHFALAYSNIFSSQINALDALNSRAVTYEEAKEMFTKLQEEKEPFREWTLQKYLNFLVVWGFIARTQDGYEITETGRNFLNFLVSNGLSKDRGPL